MAVFLGRQDGGFQFIEVGHCLQKDKIRPRRHTGLHNFRKSRVGIGKGQRAGRSQQFAQGADIQPHQRTGGRRPTAGTGQGRLHHLGHTIACTGQFACVGPKGIGQQQICPGGRIVGMDGRQNFRHFQGCQFRFLAGLQAALL